MRAVQGLNFSFVQFIISRRCTADLLKIQMLNSSLVRLGKVRVG